MPASDEQLMLAYAGGDAAAFAALYARHKGALFRFVLRSVKGEAVAEELFQEIWIRAIEARGRYRPEAKFTTWLFTIAHNRIVDHWRARGLALVSLDDEEHASVEAVAPPSAEPHANLEASRTARKLAEAIEALPLAQREAFLMHQEGELTVGEIAAATGSNEEAAKSRLRYAISKLKEAIGDE
jgi:RNA polymerase sigma-70 factor (ECF subfamily)